MPKFNILLVEDNEKLQERMKEILSEFGGRIWLAANGREALDLFNRERRDIDFIITDHRMPELNGFELVKAVRQRSPLIPIIVCSSNLRDEWQTLYKKYRVSCLNKPVDIEILRKTIHELHQRSLIHD